MTPMTKETLKVEHHGFIVTMKVWFNPDTGKRHAKIDGHWVNVMPSVYPKDVWTTDNRLAKSSSL